MITYIFCSKYQVANSQSSKWLTDMLCCVVLAAVSTTWVNYAYWSVGRRHIKRSNGSLLIVDTCKHTCRFAESIGPLDSIPQKFIKHFILQQSDDSCRRLRLHSHRDGSNQTTLQSVNQLHLLFRVSNQNQTVCTLHRFTRTENQLWSFLFTYMANTK